MASAFSHAVVAVTFGMVSSRHATCRRFWSLSILCAILPDIDVLGFTIGIRYGDLFGHRGLTHSLSFALVLSIVVVRAWFPAVPTFSRAWWGFIAHFFLVTASHGLLDAMTNGGLGVAFFAPFDNTRYFLPWTPVQVSPIGLAPFFSSLGVQVILSELVWIWTPAACIVFIVTALRIRSSK